MGATISVSLVAQSVLPAVLPQSLIHASIKPSEASVTLHLLVYVDSLILAAGLPGEYTIPVPLVLQPLPNVAAVLGPVLSAAALDLVLEELPHRNLTGFSH